MYKHRTGSRCHDIAWVLGSGYCVKNDYLSVEVNSSYVHETICGETHEIV